jgi:hypothetical protein
LKDGVYDFPLILSRIIISLFKGTVYEVVNLLEICRRRQQLKEEDHSHLYGEAEEIAKC